MVVPSPSRVPQSTILDQVHWSSVSIGNKLSPGTKPVFCSEMFSLSGMSPGFPSLLPRQADPLWHRVDLPKDEDAELTKMEKENEERMKGFTQVVRKWGGGK